MSIKIRHARQVKVDSFARAVAFDVVWVSGLDEMQMIMYAPINMITGQHHEYIQSIASKRVKMVSLLDIAPKVTMW